jgi:uncharacterized protein (DUF2126 family)
MQGGHGFFVWCRARGIETTGDTRLALTGYDDVWHRIPRIHRLGAVKPLAGGIYCMMMYHWPLCLLAWRWARVLYCRTKGRPVWHAQQQSCCLQADPVAQTPGSDDRDASKIISCSRRGGAGRGLDCWYLVRAA